MQGKIGLCWDLAKSWKNTSLEKFFWDNLTHVKQVHLHDVRIDEKGTPKSHCVIGSGDFDFVRYLARLVESDVTDYCIEVRPREKAKASLQALKLLLGQPTS